LTQTNLGPVGTRRDREGAWPNRGTGCGGQQPRVGARKKSHRMVVI